MYFIHNLLYKVFFLLFLRLKIEKLKKSFLLGLPLKLANAWDFSQVIYVRKLTPIWLPCMMLCSI